MFSYNYHQLSNKASTISIVCSIIFLCSQKNKYKSYSLINVIQSAQCLIKGNTTNKEKCEKHIDKRKLESIAWLKKGFGKLPLWYWKENVRENGNSCVIFFLILMNLMDKR